MQRVATLSATRPAAAPPLHRRRLHVAAATQPGQDQQRGAPAAPDAPPAPPQPPKGVQLELFETKGTDAAAASTSSQDSGGPWAQLLSSFDFSEPTSFDGEEKTEYDPLRDGPLRYLGYANELGEAFAAWLFAGGVPLRWVLGPAAACSRLLRGCMASVTELWQGGCNV